MQGCKGDEGESVQRLTASRHLSETQNFWEQSLEAKTQRQMSGVCGRVYLTAIAEMAGCGRGAGG